MSWNYGAIFRKRKVQLPMPARSRIEPRLKRAKEALLGRADAIGTEDPVKPGKRIALGTIGLDGFHATFEKPFGFQLATRSLAGSGEGGKDELLARLGRCPTKGIHGGRQHIILREGKVLIQVEGKEQEFDQCLAGILSHRADASDRV